MGRRNTGSVTFLPAIGKWQVRITDPISKKRRSLTVDTEEEAEDIRQAALARLQRQSPTLAGQTLGVYTRQWLRDHADDYAPGTWRSRVNRLELHVLRDDIAKVQLSELQPADFHRLLNGRLRKTARLGFSSRRNIRAALMAVLKSAVKDGRIERNPLRDVDIEGRDVVNFHKFDKDQLLKLLYDPRVPRVRQLKYRVTFFLGQRADDVWGIQLSNVDLEAGVISIWCSKQQALIRYPLLAGAQEAIREWIAYLQKGKRQNPDGLLFPSRRTGKRRLSTSGNPIRALQDDCKRLGIVASPGTRITWHSWRGTLATALQAGWLSDERWTAEEAARQLGHRSAATTRRHYTVSEYVNPVDRLREKAAKVGLRVLDGGRAAPSSETANSGKQTRRGGGRGAAPPGKSSVS